MSDVFGGELARLMAQTKQTGAMYDGWQFNNKASDKRGEGVYVDPFDAQGAGQINEELTRRITRLMLERFGNTPDGAREAERRIMEMLEGRGQSPTDKSGGQPANVSGDGSSPYYGGALSVQGQGGQAPNPYNGMSPDEWARYMAFRAAESEKEKDRKEREEAERAKKALEGRDKDESERAMSLLSNVSFQRGLAELIAPTLSATIEAKLDAFRSALGVQAPAQSVQQPAQQPPSSWYGQPTFGAMQGAGQAQGAMSAPQTQFVPTPQHPQVPQGQFQGVMPQDGYGAGTIPGGSYRDLPGVQLPPQPTNQSMLSSWAQQASGTQQAPQSTADKFLSAATELTKDMTNPYQKTQVMEEARIVYGGILSGSLVVIDNPILRKAADTTGVQYVPGYAGFGGAN